MSISRLRITSRIESLVHEHVVHRSLEVVGVDPLGHREVALRVHVHAQHPVALLGECCGQVECCSRLGHAALLVGERDDLGLSFHGDSDARLWESRPGGYSHSGPGDSCMGTTIPGWRRAIRHRASPARLAGKRVCICLGAGGVGKTTTSAALALGLAARGQKVAVITIDPARRLAAALGLQRAVASEGRDRSSIGSTLRCSPRRASR